MKKPSPYPSPARTIPGRFSWDMMEPVFKLFILSGSLAVLYLALQENILFQNNLPRIPGAGQPFFRFLFLFSLVTFLSSLVVRTILWFRYKPYPSARVTCWPEITLVIPAYNEGQTIYRTLRSLMDCDYPEGRVKILTINDGSTDDTLSFMERACREFPGRIRIVNFKCNRGKRQAIYHAYRISRSPILITVDSDTKPAASALKELVTPLILNPRMGAVTSRIRVWNKKTNILTRMLHAHFAMAFDFTRAIQSTFHCVFCVAGAFSAYRRSAMEQIIDRWIRQKFLNITCTYGEDRSLTNMILREGYQSFFQRTAVAYTMVPVRLGQILKMLTRWARSNIRESIIFSKFMFQRRRRGNILLPAFEFITTVIMVFLHFVWFYYFLFSGLIDLNFVFRVLAYSVFSGFFYILYYVRIEGRKDSPYLVLFSIFSCIFMIWIFTVAAFTLTKTGWSTR